MHQKKSEDQIGKESSGVSSDFNPTPPLISSSVIHHKYLQPIPQDPSQFIPYQSHNTNLPKIQTPPPKIPSATKQPRNDIISNSPLSPSSTTTPSTPHKRPMMNRSPSNISHSPTLSSLHHYKQTKSSQYPSSFNSSPLSPIRLSSGTRAAAFRLLRHLRRVRILRVHLRLLFLLSVPSFYFFLFNPRRSFLLDFLAALAFSALFLLFYNLAIPRLPPIRLLLGRSSPLKFPLSSRPQPPVLWSIGSTPKPEKRIDSGCDVRVYGNGDVYEGEFHKGKCSGSGVYYYYMSGRYEGDWIDEKYDGYGVETWARGSRYRGQYRHGLRHGYGVYRFYTGDVYAGEWSNGQSHGCGVHTCEDGSRYVGEFKWGVKHGLGHYHFRNGDTYAGEYFSDKMHGFGVYKFGNGHYYEGAWHEGRRQGLGMYTFRNGETQFGHWQNGILNIPSTQIPHHESPIAVNHSKVLNAVQEARRAAEKAYNVARLDERVNKAVAAANKAANAARVASVKAVQKRMHNNDTDDIPMSIV